MKTRWKLVWIGILTTVVRAMGQAWIPNATSSVLTPSVFVEQGTMPIAFIVYGAVAYGIIAALYVLIEKRITGHHIMKGLKYGIACSVIWIVYLLEPMPHVSPIDKVTYPVIDGVALLFLGVLLGLFFTNPTKKSEHKTSLNPSRTWLDCFCVTACFMIGRLILYFVFDIYSSFDTENLQTVLWMAFTGIVIALVVLWFEAHLEERNKVKRALLSGAVLFGIDLFLFNFFMPLIFQVNLLDLLLRSTIDVVAVTSGLLLLPVPIHPRKRVCESMRQDNQAR